VNALPAGAKALRTYIPDGERLHWREAEMPFDEELPSELAAVLSGPFAYPLGVPIERRDRFFGMCLGNGEAGQLSFATDGGGKEIGTRLALHIDDDCEPLRHEDADRMGKLVHCLRERPERLPGQLRHMQQGLRFHLADDYPQFNLFPVEGEERDGVWVAYARSEHRARELSVRLCRQVGKDREHQVCVFSTKAGSHDTVAYPVRDIECTSPARVRPHVEFTEGRSRSWSP